MPKKKNNALFNRLHPLCRVTAPGVPLLLTLTAGALAVVSIMKPYAAAAVLPWFLWVMLAAFALFCWMAGWRRPRFRRFFWSGAVLAALGGPLLEWTVKADCLAGAGAGVFCLILALAAGQNAWNGRGDWFSRICEGMLFLLYSGAGVLALFVFSRHYEAAARHCGVLFAAAALKNLAQFIECFSATGKDQKKC